MILRLVTGHPAASLYYGGSICRELNWNWACLNLQGPPPRSLGLTAGLHDQEVPEPHQMLPPAGNQLVRDIAVLNMESHEYEFMLTGSSGLQKEG